MPESTPLLIRGGRVIDPARALDATADLLIDGDRVVSIETKPRAIQASGARVIDAEGCIVSPGLIDPHVHLREPGQTQKETLATGAASAIHGGFTTVCCMPNTSPALDTPALVEFIRLKSQEIGLARIFTVAAATVARKGEQLAPIQALVKAGAVGFSDDGECVDSAAMMERVLRLCKVAGRPFMQHCQERTLTEKAVMHDGVVSARLGLRGWPRAAEELIVERDVRLNREIGAAYHAQHLSSGGSVEILRRAQAEGQPVTGEVAPHHLLLTDDACTHYDTHAKMNPPLRESSDLAALKAGVAEGVISVLATDHAPHTPDEKLLEFEHAPFGIIGLDCALPLYIKALVEDGVIDWPRLIAMMTLNPARLVGLDACGLGRLEPGGVADVTVIDPHVEWEIDVTKFRSKSRNCPFHGWRVKGRARTVIVGGRVLA
jgi:dihydroorotase